MAVCANAQCHHDVVIDSLKQCTGKCSERASSSPHSTLIIWYDATKRRNKKALLKAVRKYKAKVIYDYKNFNGIAIKIPDGSDINSAITYFQKVKGVLQVSRDQIMHLD